jgi:hypothetical protein
MSPSDYMILFPSLAIAIAFSVWVTARYLTSSRKVRAELTTDRQYRGLADEYRRLSDMAITSQEHVDLRLTELGVQLEDLRTQMENLQRILKEVE